MGRIEIIDKLDLFLSKHNPLTEECHVLYILVEIRKVLDREQNYKYPVLRFYCDWSVHVDKSKLVSEINSIMNNIYQEVENQITNPELLVEGKKMKILEFMKMLELKKEVLSFLNEYNLPTFIINDANWIKFVKLLVMILTDQSIINKLGSTMHANIKKIVFLPSNEKFIICRIDFNQAVCGCDYFEVLDTVE